MPYKCDSCECQTCEPPSQEEPHGSFYCRHGHWEGTGFRDQEPLDDPWKWCKDYQSKNL